MRIRAGLLTLALVGLPVSGKAFPGDPLCAVPEPSALSDMPGQLCEPGTSYLVRSQALDECAPVSGREERQQSYEVAKRALARARELERAGLHDAALLHLRVVEATLPRIADHIALMRAELHSRAGDPAQAARAYADAMRIGMNTDLVARANVGYVRSLLDAGDVNAERELDALLRRYPKLPEAPQLKLALAKHREADGAVKTALATYRLLDLTLPGYPVASEARARIEALKARGVVSAPYTTVELFARADKLVQSGPVELARKALEELSPLARSKAQIAEFNGLRARLEGTDASHVPAEANLAVAALDEAARQKRVRALIGNKKLDKMRPFQLMSLLDSASREHLTEAADALVLELARRTHTSPVEVRFDALVTAAGAASDLALVELADTLVDQKTIGPAARYHRARAIERMGRVEDAKAELLRVIELDQSATRFYANWADQRLRVLAGEKPALCPDAPFACADDSFAEAVEALEISRHPDLNDAIALLEQAALEHGQAFPWIMRALDLARIDEARAAADELYEALLAYRSLTSRRGIRAGLEAVYRGTSVARPAGSIEARRARLALGPGRITLAKACAALGDDGTAAMFGGPAWAESRPHPYPREVALAAKKHGVDPDLLFAVMRVESVYQRRIISHAGAVGLMQIMPRTGRLIADQLGEQYRTTSDLLDPQTNLDFAAWYLKSLLQRMGGQLPLAIASYNGGPHNVRKWIRSFGEHVPLDAFLERIPFTETRRYVRRVLDYYVRYKSLRGAKIALMDVTLPRSSPTDVTF